MQGTVNPNNLLFDPEIEKTTRERRKQIRRKAQEAMGDQHNHLNNLPPPNRDVEDPPPQPRIMRDFVMPPVSGCVTGIRKPTINANNFEIKASLIQLVQHNQFRGDRDSRKGVYELNTLDTILTQNEQLAQQVASLNKKLETFQLPNPVGASIQKLETQIGQIAEQLAERPLGSLPTSTIPNPRGELKAITTRRGTIIEPKPSKTQGRLENTDNHQVIEENDLAENVSTLGPESRISCGSPRRKKKNDME
ncbi:hypothetical protein L6164_001245 [Bauhinia variegata]|uniref:Uncharacterized protein n=1 Tax=Bauhinia variegata TaxID=167791 RepID=A0ACB9Q9H5_BAUVA|nr:hypothetical protein L6164_001245 [Bauhinia variegata]